MQVIGLVAILKSFAVACKSNNTVLIFAITGREGVAVQSVLQMEHTHSYAFKILLYFLSFTSVKTNNSRGS